MRQLSMVSHTEDYEYNKIVVGDNTDPNLIWFVVNVSQRHLDVISDSSLLRDL